MEDTKKPTSWEQFKNLLNEYKVIMVLLTIMTSVITWSTSRAREGMATQGSVDSLAMAIDTAKTGMRTFAQAQVQFMLSTMDERIKKEFAPFAEEVLLKLNELSVKYEHQSRDLEQVKKSLATLGKGEGEYTKRLEAQLRQIELTQAREETLEQIRRQLKKWDDVVSKPPKRIPDNDSRTPD